MKSEYEAFPPASIHPLSVSAGRQQTITIILPLARYFGKVPSKAGGGGSSLIHIVAVVTEMQCHLAEF